MHEQHCQYHVLLICQIRLSIAYYPIFSRNSLQPFLSAATGLVNYSIRPNADAGVS